jgi:Flp pilus assembly protein TadG
VLYKSGTTRRRLSGDETGAAAVEFALVAMLLFLLVFGIIEFGFIFNRWLTLTHAAREGVRELAIGEDPAVAEANSEGSAGPNTAKFGSTAIDCTASSAVNADGTTTVTMQCQSEYQLNLLGALPIPNPVPLESTANMRKE